MYIRTGEGLSGERASKLSFATTWINTFDACGMIALNHCDDVANGFGKMMEAGGHSWAINFKDKEAKPEDWMDRDAAPGFVCAFRGNDAAPGRGVDTVDFAMIVSHGAVWSKTSKWPNFVSVGFNQKHCRFCSTQTRFGNGKLKWLILDSCHSLELDEKKGIQPWVVWRHSFHGLHTMFGFNGKVSDAWWTEDRGASFAFQLIASDAEMADAWIDAAYSDTYRIHDIPVAAAAGRDPMDAKHRLETERLSSSFDSIPNKEVKWLAYRWRS